MKVLLVWGSILTFYSWISTAQPAEPPTTPPLDAGAAVAQPDRDTAKVLVRPHMGFRSEKMTCQLATAVSAFQVNLKTGDWQRLALMSGWGCSYRGVVPMGAALYSGFGMSRIAPTTFQVVLLLNVFDWGALGPGVQVYGELKGLKAQWLLTLALNLNIGSSVSTLLKLEENADRVLPVDTSP